MRPCQYILFLIVFQSFPYVQNERNLIGGLWDFLMSPEKRITLQGDIWGKLRIMIPAS